MRVAEMNWMDVEAYLARDDRCVVPLGSTEQHAQLSLAVDSILSERVAVEAAEPLGVPVFPCLSYGLTPYFYRIPGNGLAAPVDLSGLDRGCARQPRQGPVSAGSYCVNGHGGNAAAGAYAIEWMARTPHCTVRFHNWWNAPKTMAQVQRTDPVASHASWMENFPWTRLPNRRSPAEAKPMTDLDRLRLQNPAGVRNTLGDGNYGGLYRRPDDEMLAIWDVAVAETRALIEGPWR